MNVDMAISMHLHDGYVMSDMTWWGTHSFEWPPQKQKLVVHLSDTRKSFLIKAHPCPFVILLCIISVLQLSVAISPAFFMQINLTAQQSVSYACCCSFILSPLLLVSFSLSLLSTSFLWHLKRLLHLHYLSYKVKISTTQGKSMWLLAQHYKCKMQSFASLMLTSASDKIEIGSYCT